MAGVGTTDQAEPFQCSVRITGPGWLLGFWAPTAQQSDEVTQATPHRSEAWLPGGATLGPTDHVEPFQVSTTALGCELFPSEENTPPTARQLHALVHVLPIRRLLSDGAVLGLGMMFHPESDAPAAPDTMVIRTTSTATTAPAPRLKGRPRR